MFLILGLVIKTMISYFLLYFNPSWAPLVLRVVLGGLLTAHGFQKIGAGFAGFAGWLESLGFRPSKLFAAIVATAETVGGFFLIGGFLTHITALILIAEFLVILIRLRLMQKAPLIGQNGWELDLLYCTVLVSLLFTGPGIYSLDQALSLWWF